MKMKKITINIELEDEECELLRYLYLPNNFLYDKEISEETLNSLKSLCYHGLVQCDFLLLTWEISIFGRRILNNYINDEKDNIRY